MNGTVRDLEISIIGAVCIDFRCLQKIRGVLQAEDFSSKLCAQVYQAALDAADRSNPFDAVVAAELLTPAIGEAEANSFLRQCMEATPTLAHTAYHAGLLHDMSQFRSLRDTISEQLLLPEATAGREELDALAAGIIGLCRTFLEGRRPERTVSLAQALRNLYQQKQRKQLRVDTGFSKTDKLLCGMLGGNLVLLGARPSVGKTAMALNIAANVARRGQKVLIFSLEMLHDELAERFVAQGGVSMDTLVNLQERQQAERDPQCWRTIAEISAVLSKFPILINDDPGITVSGIRSQAMAEEGLALIIVDFLTLMRSERRFESRNLEVGAMSRGLKLLASELKIPILALTQLNREKSDGEMPTLRDLRDSGELEQNANKVLLMWNVNKAEGRVGVSVAKNRNGKTGMVMFQFDGAHMRFIESMDEVPRPSKRARRAYDAIEDEEGR